ncbi:hypothetical protein CspeluHIS016_0304340 [Cutaneotrichosporon spelunceum]|uniref:C2H2-type domain-containing protein n=1 Tax=Cutaneotrichosporon spelunceum TaxID=1672016 RepID=A0AAD3TTL8_9TREE|nr:hypothetical protein CspeluHIS016_0304340 [Cutaneotrichosporon spelunceum]
MNRLTTVLYPSIPGSAGSEGSPANPSPQDSVSSSAFPVERQLSLNVNVGARSIYNDPRATRFPSPPPTLDRSNSDVDTGTARTQRQRRATEFDVGSSSSSAADSLKRTGTLTPTATLHGGPDRSLRVNLMAACVQPNRRNRSSAGPTATGRLNAMAKGPKGQYVVGGSQYLRVLEITKPSEVDDGSPKPRTQFARGPGGVGICEVVNLWRPSWGPNKGVNDVDWGCGNFENKIVTATPSVHWMIFDLERGKLDREVGGGHTRSVNVIRASKMPSFAHTVLTGGQEGQVRLWDLRAAEPTNRKYYKHNASITALSLCLDDPHQFVVGTDTGGLFRYDSRVAGKAIGKLWGAHGSKTVLDLKWKESEEFSLPGQGWLASAGSDRTVQVWDMSKPWDKGATATHILHTAYAIRGVDWRPSHPTEVVVVPWDQLTATASPDSNRLEAPPSLPLESEQSLEVWDVRRHYIAKYTLPGHDSTAIAASWVDDDTVVACYQNGGLVQIDLHSRVAPKAIPLETIPRQFVTFSCKGEVAYAVDRFKLGEIPFDDVKPEFAAHWQVGGRARKAPGDQAYEPTQAMGVLPLSWIDNDEFRYLAYNYRLEGMTPVQLCQWNRDVASMCDRTDDARIWQFLIGMFDEFGRTNEGMFNEAVFSQAATAISPRPPSPHGLETRRTSDETVTPGTFPGIPMVRGEDIVAPEFGTSEDGSGSSESGGPETPPRSRFKSFILPTANDVQRPNLAQWASSGSSLLTASGMIRVPKKLGFESPMSDDEESVTPIADMDYPDAYGISAALETASSAPYKIGVARSRSSRSTPQSTRAPSPSKAPNGGRRSATGSMRGSQRPSITERTMDRIQPVAITRPTQDAFPPVQWDDYREARNQSFLDWWEAYIEDGEVQLATALYIVGSKVITFPQKQVERILDTYLNLLEAHHLPIPLAYYRRFSNIVDAQTVSGMDGVSHVQYCVKCGKSTGSLDDTCETKTFWWCTKCHRAAKICTICREPVKGLWMSCNTCRHGGHQRCMRLYYTESGKLTVMPAPEVSRAASPSPGTQVGRRSSNQQTGVPSSSYGSNVSGLTATSYESSSLSTRAKQVELVTPSGAGDGETDGGTVQITSKCPAGPSHPLSAPQPGPTGSLPYCSYFKDHCPDSFYTTGWQTVCPRLLSPDAVPVPYLLVPGRLARPPSPTPTMSSEDEPVQRTRLPSHQQLPLAPPPLVSSANPSSTPADMPAPPNKGSSAGSDAADTPSTEIRAAILNSQKMTDEPKSVEPPSSMFATPAAPTSNGSHNPPRPSRWTKARSTSTESFVSSMDIPATLGSQYNQEGFPNYPVSSEDEDGDVRIVADGEAVAKQLAQTDEAVRQINGTSSVVQRNFGNMMPSAPSSNQYELPRAAAAFVRRPAPGNLRRERGDIGSFVSSGSSTSSEESDFLPGISWVNSVSQPTASNTYNYQFYYTKPSNSSNPSMPPPSTIGNRKPSSPRRGSLNQLPSSDPATPNALQHKLPNAGDSSTEVPGDNDEDDQTVGPREGSPSSSSASALDLLALAVDQHENENQNPRHRSYSTYLKRQQGAEAVAQWRHNAIPPAYDNPRGFEGTPPEGRAPHDGSREPPKKRRRSEKNLEAPDQSLRSQPSDPSEDSDIESHGSASDSEYNAGKKRNRRNSNKDKGSRVRATLPMPPAQTSPSSSKDSPAPASKKPQPKVRRPSGTSDGKPSIPAGGVQCEYVNPLPPYQRCPDVFTRKYDIPRHMARHARREGDLVQEGKLPEEKALLWKTIRDKPRIRCKVCLEYFTRQDALKRHQNKQHHH